MTVYFVSKHRYEMVLCPLTVGKIFKFPFCDNYCSEFHVLCSCYAATLTFELNVAVNHHFMFKFFSYVCISIVVDVVLIVLYY